VASNSGARRKRSSSSEISDMMGDYTPSVGGPPVCFAFQLNTKPKADGRSAPLA
jgi:hypothetical protein